MGLFLGDGLGFSMNLKVSVLISFSQTENVTLTVASCCNLSFCRCVTWEILIHVPPIHCERQCSCMIVVGKYDKNRLFGDVAIAQTPHALEIVQKSSY